MATEIQGPSAPGGNTYNRACVTDLGEVKVSVAGAVSPAGYASISAANSPVTVTAAATLIVAARAGRGGVTISNEGGQSMRVGASDVTFTTKGILLVPGASIPLTTTAAVYGICNTALSTSAGYIEEY